MQIKKDNISKSILKVAKDEFLVSGYKNTSMRTISKKSGIGLSNIYNYFKNKDEIFVEILKPLLSYIDTLFNKHNDEENISLPVFLSKEYQAKGITNMVSLVENYRDEFRLLLFNAYGSTLESFREEYADKYTEVSLDFMLRLKVKHPQINMKISKLFIHTLGSWMFAIIGKIVMHQKLSHQEIEEFMYEYITFSTAGWKEIMKS